MICLLSQKHWPFSLEGKNGGHHVLKDLIYNDEKETSYQTANLGVTILIME